MVLNTLKNRGRNYAFTVVLQQCRGCVCFRTSLGFPFHPSFGNPSPRTVCVYTSSILDILSHLLIQTPGTQSFDTKAITAISRSYRQDLEYMSTYIHFPQRIPPYTTRTSTAPCVPAMQRKHTFMRNMRRAKQPLPRRKLGGEYFDHLIEASQAVTRDEEPLPTKHPTIARGDGSFAKNKRFSGFGMGLPD